MAEIQYESKVIDQRIAYWKFKEEATGQTFASAFNEFLGMVGQPAITNLLVNVEMKNAWNRSIQDIWLKTGEVADHHGITKWAVVTSETGKELTIRYLIKGGAGGKRRYAQMVTDDEAEAIDWLLS
ncbi:MAG: hypothetical protein AAGA85_15725 [Bacteroidota bacterium]